MKFGLFYEHQIPRPWSEESEHLTLTNALEQVELADRLGIDYIWEVEHHFLEEYSHSSAPECFLAAASQRTRNIRLGHGVVLLPPAFNHPVRVAERIATLDLLSNGRVDFGSGESSSEMELAGFGIPRDDKRRQWEAMIEVIPRLLVETPFAGCDTPYVKIPPRNVVPKPLQKPHPPLWVACSQRDTAVMAGHKGLGALAFAFVLAAEAKEWVDGYYQALEEAVPVGYAVNPNITVVTPFLCAKSEAEAIDRGIDGGHFFGYSLAHYYGFGRHRPGRTDVWAEFLANREQMGFKREIPAQTAGVDLTAIRGAVGTPEQVYDFLETFEDIGVDQVVLVAQSGNNRHEHVCESLELFAREVLPRFRDRHDAHEKAKMERIRPVVDRAMARRDWTPRTVDESYRVKAAMKV